MTDDEIEIVAEELAKIGGTSWYPGREDGSLIRVLSDRYRDRARIAITALDRYRARSGDQHAQAARHPVPAAAANPVPDGTDFEIGMTVIYRPPGDRRAYACRVEEVEDGRIYLVPTSRQCTGWVPVGSILQQVDPSSSDD
ncbi:hypothetical protein [Microvirga pudoricolor]|uniref:hypothetical protein n=1 Tax=Microvirga pudoricolor TaxID=2778729 RepID=UPI00194F4325|nr:hypothetical protein [Microvirga pudoricolor]MBM6595194.1 hypothetical protein [Microvirga pudoricolor]